MIIAEDKYGNRVNSIQQPSLMDSYFCPACKASLIFKNGLVYTPHFAHRTLNDCHAWSENESAQHLSLKLQLFEWFHQSEKVELEKYLPELEQTPDLLVNDRIAIEIQCSSLSLKRLKERTENYQAYGFKVIWLMGKDLWIKKGMTTLQKNLMGFSENRGFYFWELDEKNQKLRLKSLIHEDLAHHTMYLTDVFEFQKGNLLSLLRLPFEKQKCPVLEIPEQDGKSQFDFIQRQLYHCAPSWLKKQALFYENQKHLLDLDFSKKYVAPAGLDLLCFPFQKVEQKFIQLHHKDTIRYYQEYYRYFQTHHQSFLYPPYFYHTQ